MSQTTLIDQSSLSSASTASARRVRMILSCCLGFLIIITVLQVLGPLRIDTDGWVYLGMAGSITDHGFMGAMKTQYPRGYPTLISVLERSGMANSASIIGLNVLSVFAALAAMYRISLRWVGLSRNQAIGALCCVLLNFVLWKHLSFAVSDVVYLGLSMVALLTMLELEARKFASGEFWRLFITSMALTVIATSVRAIGIALVPALLLAVLSSAGLLETFKTDKHFRNLTLIAGFVLAAAAAAVLLRGGYGAAYIRNYRLLGWGRIYRVPLGPVRDLTQLLLNAPEGRIPGFEFIGYLVGLIPAALLTVWFYRKWQTLDAMYVYLGCYLAILTISPWPASRYWLPILPLVAAIIFKTLPRRTNRYLLIAYCCLYCAMGLVSIAYCTRLTFAGPRFPELFGTREYEADYQQWMGSKVTGRVDSVRLQLLNRYAGSRH
jgi:hypothetical protein